MSFRAIAYASTATRDLTDADLAVLLEAARRLNAETGLTGVLLHCDGNFMQYVEGPAEAVEAAYGRIRASRRHYQLNELMNETIAEREFPHWPMGFTSDVDNLPADFTFDGAEDGPGPGAALLQTFWRTCRGFGITGW